MLSERQELAFEDAVPYDDIVVWVRPRDVSHLNAILRAIPIEDILHRLRIIETIWSLYWYEPGTGAAMDAILGEISRRKYSSHPKRHYMNLESVGTWQLERRAQQHSSHANGIFANL